LIPKADRRLSLVFPVVQGFAKRLSRTNSLKIDDFDMALRPEKRLEIFVLVAPWRDIEDIGPTSAGRRPGEIVEVAHQS